MKALSQIQPFENAKRGETVRAELPFATDLNCREVKFCKPYGSDKPEEIIHLRRIAGVGWKRL
jgi:hypothetical protein